MQQHKELVAHDSIETLSIKLKTTSDGIFKTRLKAIILRKNNHSPQDIAERLMVNDRSVRTWVTIYNQGGIAGLKPKSAGRTEGNPKWDVNIFTALATEVDKGGYWSIPRMQDWISDNYRVDIPEQTVWYHMDKLDYSYKSARPCPFQGNKEQQEVFKKGVSPRSWSRD